MGEAERSEWADFERSDKFKTSDERSSKSLLTLPLFLMLQAKRAESKANEAQLDY